MTTAVSHTIAYESHTDFSHVKPEDTQFLPGGLRDFFVYRDLGVAAATRGKVIAHIAKANCHPTTAPAGITTWPNFKSSSCSRAGHASCTAKRPRWCLRATAYIKSRASSITCSTTHPTWST